MAMVYCVKSFEPMEKKHFIRLKNAVFYGYHGNHHEERHLGGRFHVDVEMETDFTAAAEQDDLEAAHVGRERLAEWLARLDVHRRGVNRAAVAARIGEAAPAVDHGIGGELHPARDMQPVGRPGAAEGALR